MTPGGQPRYSALAITTALTLRGVFRLALRPTEGLIGSVVPRTLLNTWPMSTTPCRLGRSRSPIGFSNWERVKKRSAQS